MIRELIVNQIKETLRGQKMGTTIATRIIMILMLLYFTLIFISLGFFFHEMSEELFPNETPINIFNKYLFYYLIFDVTVRVLFQEVNAINFKYFSLLPIKKSSIINYVLHGTYFSVFNILPLFIIIPVFLKVAIPAYGILSALLWLVTCIGFILFNNFLCLELKNRVSNKPIYYVLLIGVSMLIYFLDHQGVIPFSSVFQYGMATWSPIGLSGVLVLTMVFSIYRFVFMRMRRQAYLIPNRSSKQSLFESIDVSGLGDNSLFSSILQLNLLHIFRNKRIRTHVIMGFMFLFFGGFILQLEAYSGAGWKIFWGFYITGILPMQLAQYLWSFQSGYFELLQTLPFSMKKYINAQYSFYWILTASTALPAMFYYFLEPQLPKFFIVCTFYVLGLMVPFLMAISAYNKKKMDINTSGTFNMQGISGQQFVFIFGILLFPIFIFLPFYIWHNINMGLMVLGGVGFLGILCRPLFVRFILEIFIDKKYTLTEGFRSN